MTGHRSYERSTRIPIPKFYSEWMWGSVITNPEVVRLMHECYKVLNEYINIKPHSLVIAVIVLRGVHVLQVRVDLTFISYNKLLQRSNPSESGHQRYEECAYERSMKLMWSHIIFKYIIFPFSPYIIIYMLNYLKFCVELHVERGKWIININWG